MQVGGGVQGKGNKGGKWDNCNSIINKIYLKNRINSPKIVYWQSLAILGKQITH